MEEDEKDVLEWVACVKQNLLVLCYLHDVKVRRRSFIAVRELQSGKQLAQTAGAYPGFRSIRPTGSIATLYSPWMAC